MKVVECPNCGNENVASFAATLSATKVGQALREAGERSSNIGYAARDSWLVAKYLKPPKKPSIFAMPAFFYVGFLVIGAFVGSLATMFIKPESALQVGILCGGGFSVILFISSALSLNTPEMRDLYQRKVAAWERLMYCSKCESAFDPESGDCAPVQKANTLILPILKRDLRTRGKAPRA